jgi:hypothetical protein
VTGRISVSGTALAEELLINLHFHELAIPFFVALTEEFSSTVFQ